MFFFLIFAVFFLLYKVDYWALQGVSLSIQIKFF